MNSTYLYFPAIKTCTVETETLSDAPLKRDEVVIRAETSIISAGTELARYCGIEPNATLPARPGYGVIGRVEQVGEGTQGIEVGKRYFCAGKHASVQRFQHNQHHQWGYLYPAPEDCDPVDSVFATMAEISMTAPDVATFKLGDTVAVFGLGVVGNLAAQMFQHAGARVIGLDPVPERCQTARKTGLKTVLQVPPMEQVEAIKQLTDGEGARVTVDAAGHSAVVINAMLSTARYGDVVLLGSPRAPFTVDITPSLFHVHSNGIRVLGAHMWRLPHKQLPEVVGSVQRNFAKSFELIRDGRLKVAPLRSHIIRVQQAPEIYKGLLERPNEHNGVVIDWR